MGSHSSDRLAVRDPRSSADTAGNRRHRHAVRLADVRLLDPVHIAVGVAGTLKATGAMLDGSPLVALAVVAAVCAMLVNVRVGAALLLPALVPLLVNNHTVFLFLVAALIAGFPDRGQRLLLFKTQLTALYFYASVAKMNAEWLSGVSLGWHDPLWLFHLVPIEVVTVGAVLIELFLAVAIWLAPRFAWRVGLVFHTAVVVGMAGATGYLLELLVFNGLAAVVLLTVARHEAPAR